MYDLLLRMTIIVWFLISKSPCVTVILSTATEQVRRIFMIYDFSLLKNTVLLNRKFNLQTLLIFLSGNA